jgi:16S rRNA (guanine527-N7)-methyltransferase
MFRDLLVSEWAPFGTLSEDQIFKLEQHYKLLKSWDKVLNLTRIERLEDVVRLHYCESMFLASVLPEGQQSIVDLGSGAGFPGIPIAVLRPECSITLLESHRRKAVFLAEACVGIPNVEVIGARAEAIQKQFDWLVARAVQLKAVFSLRLASRVAILMSENDLTRLPSAAQTIRVPWGDRRIVALFHVEHQSAKI